MKRTILIVFIIICAFVIGMGLWYVRVRMLGINVTTKKRTPSHSQNVNTTTTPTGRTAPEPLVATKPPISQPLDADHDGLADADEKKAGTDPLKADTDADGLTDRQEVVVYHTNPLNADTDNDGVKDGDEVRAGTNPNGTGKLLDLQQALRNK